MTSQQWKTRNVVKKGATMFLKMFVIGVVVSFLLGIAGAQPTERSAYATTEANNNSVELLPSGCEIFESRIPGKTVTLLRCKHTGLKSIPNLDHNLNIEVVDLSGNNISKVRKGGGFDQVKRINLERNIIKTITPESLAELKHVQKLYIGNNPFHCDCQLEWLRVRLLGPHNLAPYVGRARDIKCASPAILHDRALQTLTKEQLCGTKSRTSDENTASANRTKETKVLSSPIIPVEGNEMESKEVGRVAEIIGVTMAFVTVIAIMSVIFILM